MRGNDFDLKALFAALDAQRQARGLTWAQVTRDINAVGPAVPRHPIATSTITGLRTKAVAEGAGVLQMLRWLGRAPESFIGGLSEDLAAARLPAVDRSQVLRFDTRKLFEALDQQRNARGLMPRARRARLARPGDLSHRSSFARLLVMDSARRAARHWLTAVVVLHLVISVLHGAVHRAAGVPLSPAAALFVFVVIVAGPLAGVALMRRTERLGAWIVAFTMAGSLAFGLLNHFAIPGADHVAHVARQWQLSFAATAVGLALTEGFGAALALRLAKNTEIVT